MPNPKLPGLTDLPPPKGPTTTMVNSMRSYIEIYFKEPALDSKEVILSFSKKNLTATLQAIITTAAKDFSKKSLPSHVLKLVQELESKYPNNFNLKEAMMAYAAKNPKAKELIMAQGKQIAIQLHGRTAANIAIYLDNGTEAKTKQTLKNEIAGCSKERLAATLAEILKNQVMQHQTVPSEDAIKLVTALSKNFAPKDFSNSFGQARQDVQNGFKKAYENTKSIQYSANNVAVMHNALEYGVRTANTLEYEAAQIKNSVSNVDSFRRRSSPVISRTSSRSSSPSH